MVDMCVIREPYLLKNDYDELGRSCNMRRKRMLDVSGVGGVEGGFGRVVCRNTNCGACSRSGIVNRAIFGDCPDANER